MSDQTAQRSSRGARLGWGLAGLLLWLTSVRAPQVVHSVDLDPSWQRAYAHFFAERWQAGVDYALAHGPLGFLEVGLYEPRLLATRLVAWELLAKAAMAALLVLAVRRAGSRWARGAALALLLLVPYAVDGRVMLASLASALLLLAPRPPPRALVLALVPLLAVFALVKHTYAIGVLLALALVAGAWAASGARRPAAALVSGFAAALLALWVAAGQDPRHLPEFARLALEVVGGYSAAMWAPAPAGVLALALASVACASLLAARGALARPRAARAAARALLLLGFLFLAYKAVFVRHGGGETFFALAGIGTLLLPARGGAGAAEDRTGAALRAAAAALALLILPAVREHGLGAPLALAREQVGHAARAVRVLARPAAVRAELDALRADEVEVFALPRVRAAVGEASVDVVPHQSALVLLNGLRWRPRTLFQSYCAYTRSLLARNAADLAGPRAPDFLLFQAGAIDGRLPASSDALALQRIARDFRPLLREEGWLLLERRPDAGGPPPAREVLLEGRLGLGEPLDLRPFGPGPLVVALDVRPTWLGRLRTLLHQGPSLQLELAHADGVAQTWRLVPALFRGGVLVQPQLKDLDDWVALWSGAPGRSVEALRVLAAPGHRALVRDSVEVRVERAADLAFAPDPALARRLAARWFDPPPVAIDALQEPVGAVVEGRQVLVVRAPASLRFEPGAGPARLRGRFGILDEALSGRHHGEGVRFSVAVADAAGAEREVFARTLDPWREPRDRGSQPLDLALDVPAGGAVLVRTAPVAEPALLDWAWLGSLRFER